MADGRGFFNDGGAYERMMGRWSRAAGKVVLYWLALPAGLRWLDIGCGTGAFTQLHRDRYRSREVCVLDRVLTRVIEGEVPRPDFDTYRTAQTGLANTIVQHLRTMTEPDVQRVKVYLRERLPTHPNCRIAYRSRAGAVKGRVPE